MPEGRDKLRYMCDDLDRAALNREIVKKGLYTECYPSDEELAERGVPMAPKGSQPVS